MSLQFKGQVTIGVLCPLAASAVGPMNAQLTAQLNGAIALQAGLTLSPPNITAALAQLQSLIASLEALIAEGIGFPPATLQIAAVEALIANLNVTVGILSELATLFASGGVGLYVYEGAAAGFGPAIAGPFTGQGEEFSIVLSAGADAGVKTTLLSFFGGAA